MMVLRKIALPGVNAFIITCCLFALMYSLIYMEEPDLLTKVPVTQINFASALEDSEPKVTTPKPIRPREVVLQPTLPKPAAVIQRDATDAVIWGGDSFIPNPGSLDLYASSQLTIAMAFSPEYPSRALSRGIEGFVVVGFSVSEAGDVFDPYIIEAEPKGMFDRSALNAIMRFRYRARVADGKPIPSHGQRYMFTYQLES